MNVEGEGDFVAEVGNAETLIVAKLKDVLYTLKLRESLLSIAAINDHRYHVLFKKNGNVLIQDDNKKVIAEGK